MALFLRQVVGESEPNNLWGMLDEDRLLRKTTTDQSQAHRASRRGG